MEINVIVKESHGGWPAPEWLKSVAEQVLIAHRVGFDYELGLVITTQEEVQELNRVYRGNDAPTDVLAFYMNENSNDSTGFIPPPDGLKHMGEVIISIPQAMLQAKEYGHSVKKEMAILIIHGVLHLMGYDDEEPEAQLVMVAKEKEILGRIEAGLD